MPADGSATSQKRQANSERLLAYGAIALFSLAAVLALVLWVREGEILFLTRIFSEIAYCL